MFVCVSVQMSTYAQGGQKSVLGPRELESQLAVSHSMWVLGIQLRCSCRSRAQS